MKKLIIFILLLCSLTSRAENPYRIFNSFNSGELSPLLGAREDLAKYQAGCSIMENMIPLPQGGAQKRPGTKYIAEVKTSSLATRILPFEFSTSQSYIIEAGNQYMRFYTSGAQIDGFTGIEDLSGIGSITAHWLLNDNAATQTVLDDDGATHNGATGTNNTSVLYRADGAFKVGTGCFRLGGTDAVIVGDHGDFSFAETAGAAGDFSLSAWILVSANSNLNMIISKWNAKVGANDREWSLFLDANNKLEMAMMDEVDDKTSIRVSDSALADGWQHVTMTYNGANASWTGATAANYITLYVNGSAVDSTATNDAAYTKMVAGATNVAIGARYDEDALSKIWPKRIDEVAVFSKALNSTEVGTLAVSGAYEIGTPYLTADLFDLKFKQSADILYIVHPDYETRKLSRLSSASWSIDVTDIQSGPFRTQNDTVTQTLAASGTTGSITLTASGHSPFIGDTTAGHIPNGSEETDKAQTGALFKLVHPIGTLAYQETLEDKYGAGGSTVENTSWVALGTLYKDAEWTLVTTGTWTGTFEIQRNYTIGAAHDASGWEKVLQYISVDDRNVSTSGTEDVAAASYRGILTDSGDNAEACQVDFSTDQTEHIGIVEITAVASSTSATATVLTTLASTDATYKWSEGSWSNYRGWPRTVAFFEDRLTFGGNTAQPDTIWASVTSDYENFLEGAEDDDALNFTLSSSQVNVIEWLIGKDKLLIGTSGAEWTLDGAADEPLTPSSVKAVQQSTYGSANLQAVLANESVLFFQRGKEKMRELAYNWELDSYVAPDMTILANLVTDGGINDTAFQKMPDSILWCARDDGELPIFSYERAENVTAWSRMVTQTNLAGTLTDSDFEFVAVINGDPEDEVWAVVNRVVDACTVRYIEQFQPRDFGSDADDAFYVDCGVTYDSTSKSAMTGLTHLAGQTVYVLADGVVFDTAVVSGTGTITLKLGGTTTKAATVQMGLGYEVNMRTMPLSWIGGETIQGRIKKIGEVVANWYNSGDFSIGRDADTLQTYSISGQATSQDRKTFPPGWDRNGYVYFYQQSPEPLTLLGVATEFIVQ